MFRIDGAKDNDEFFVAIRSSASLVYAGIDLRVGRSGWVPDLVKVTVAEPAGHCALTLIELEAIESAALISCRKYLAEDPSEILAAFRAYLDRVIRQCRSTGDARESEFARLRNLLSDANNVTITTAGALRSSADFIEELPLIDQPSLTNASRPPDRELQSRQLRPAKCVQEYEALTFRGVLLLSQLDKYSLGRCVKVLDAVIRKHDHSGGAYHGWSANSPLKQLLSKDRLGCPELQKLILGSRNHGVTLDFEKLLSELVGLWSTVGVAQVDPEHCRASIVDYYPMASKIKGHDRVASVFHEARKYLPEIAV
jgi:hypothetical protein